MPEELDAKPFLPDIRFQDEHYVIPLPWKAEKHKLSLETNYLIAYKRLQSCMNSLKVKGRMLCVSITI